MVSCKVSLWHHSRTDLENTQPDQKRKQAADSFSGCWCTQAPAIVLIRGCTTCLNNLSNGSCKQIVPVPHYPPSQRFSRCESFLQYFEMYLALLFTDAENQLLFPLWRTLFEDRTFCSLNLEILRHNPHLTLFSWSHFKVFDTSSSSPPSCLQKVHTSSLKRNTQIPNQTPAEVWPTLSEAKSMTL